MKNKENHKNILTVLRENPPQYFDGEKWRPVSECPDERYRRYIANQIICEEYLKAFQAVGDN